MKAMMAILYGDVFGIYGMIFYYGW